MKRLYWLLVILALGGVAEVMILYHGSMRPPPLDEHNPAADRLIELETNYPLGGPGFLLPGTRVDIVAIKRGPTESWSRIVMEDVLVRRIDLPELPTKTSLRSIAEFFGWPPSDLGGFDCQLTLQISPKQEEELRTSRSGWTKYVAVLHPPDNPQQPE